MTDTFPKVIALYLPQFHPIRENDEWWGNGFTEWTNVARSKKLFKGHYQPHIPADLGFYDLRLPETRIAQAEMAMMHGIGAFCYYHYWFAGRRLLERPFTEVLRSGQPEFPFCLCWANQTWQGIWHGCKGRILLEQTYPGLEDHRKHFDLLLPAFMDERYVKVDGKPLFIIYRPLEIPGLERFVAFWRKLADVSGLPGLYLIGYSKNPAWVPQEHGFDGALIDRMPPVRPWVSRRQPFKWLSRKIQVWRGMPTIYAYEDMLDTLLPSDHTDSDFPCIVPNWDNTPRSGADGLVLHNSTPELFRMQMRAALRWIEDYEPEKRLIFVKSWNEWAEGNHLEPDLRYGRSYLKVIEGEIGCFKSADRERLSA